MLQIPFFVIPILFCFLKVLQYQQMFALSIFNLTDNIFIDCGCSKNPLTIFLNWSFSLLPVFFIALFF